MSDNTTTTDADGTGEGSPTEFPAGGSNSGGEIIVPLSLYKVIAVFSTLFSVVSVVGGFMVLDLATRRASAPAAEIDPVLALIGLGLIAAGAMIYAFSGRFKAPGMGTTKSKDEEERSNDG